MMPARLNLYSAHPSLTGTIYRASWNRPTIINEKGQTILTASVVPEAWYFSDYNASDVPFTNYDADFIKGNLTKNFFPQSLTTLPSANDYDYVVYLGAIPAGTNLQASVSLANTAQGSSGNILSYSMNPIVAPNPLDSTDHFSTDLNLAIFPFTLTTSTYSAAAGTLSGHRLIGFTFNGTDAGTYASEVILTYEDGVYTTPGPYTLPISPPDPRVKRQVQMKFLVVAEVTPAPTVQLSMQEYDLSTDDLNPAIETLSATITPMTLGYHEVGTTALGYTSIKIPSPQRKDSYIKRRFIFSNPSATDTIEEIKLFFRSSASAAIKEGVAAATAYYLCYSGTQTNATLAAEDNLGNVQPMCTGTCGQGPFNLAPGASCYIELRYQPTSTTAVKSYTLTALHKVGSDRYIHKNLDMTFQPQDPATVTISNRSTQIIKTSLGNFTSFAIDFGTVHQTTNPQAFTYDGAYNGGWNRRMALANGSTTKASFLKAYQTYYKEFINPAITDNDLKVLEPAPADYTKNVGGMLFTKIWQQNYPSSTTARIEIWANKECLVGDETGLWFQRGFVGATCFMIPILNADINYINRTLSVNSASDMDPNYVRLPYYSANRSATGSLLFHFTGTLKPNVAIASPTGANFYQEVKTSEVSNGQVTFKWNEMTPNNAALGDIVGYRIYYSTTLSSVNAVFPASTTTYLDTAKNGTGIYQLTQTNLGTNKFMYYRIFPIRQNASYTFSPNPFGLASGKYLSDPNVPALTVAIPNANFFYDHTKKILVEKGIYDVNYYTFANAKSKCTTRLRHSVTNGATINQYFFAMINTPVWNIITTRPEDSNYNLDELPVWLDSSSVNIHTKLLSNPEYNPTKELDYLYTSKIFYIKASGCGTSCTGNTAMGSAFGQPGYTSYIEPTITFASPRCYIQL